MIELVLINKLLGMLEFEFEKIDEKPWMGNELMILDLGVDE
jgi:hypothetical protein